MALGSGGLTNGDHLKSTRGYLGKISHWAVDNSRITSEECSDLGSSVVEYSPIEREVRGLVPGPTLHFFFLPVWWPVWTLEVVDWQIKAI